MATTAYFRTVSIPVWSVIPAEWSLEVSREETSVDWRLNCDCRCFIRTKQSNTTCFPSDLLAHSNLRQRFFLPYCALWSLKCIETSLKCIETSVWSNRTQLSTALQPSVRTSCSDLCPLPVRKQGCKNGCLGHLESSVSKRCWLQLNVLSLTHVCIDMSFNKLPILFHWLLYF